MEDSKITLSTDEIKQRVVKLISEKKVSFVSFENELFSVDVLDNNQIIRVIAKIEEDRVSKIQLAIKIDNDNSKVYLAAAKYFINKYLERTKKIPLQQYIEHFKSLVSSNGKPLIGSIPYDKIYQSLYPHFSYEEDEALIFFTEIYKHMHQFHRKNEVNTVEFIYKFIKKTTPTRKIYLEMGNLISNTALERGSNPPGEYSLKIILRESKEYSYELLNNFILKVENMSNPDINTLIKCSLEVGCANEEQLIRLISFKNISSFYLSQAALYAIDSNFTNALKMFASKSMLPKLESNVQNAICVFLLKVDKESARLAMRSVLEARPSYEAYKLYKSMLTEEEIKTESAFFEAVANAGGFIGAYHLENKIMLSESELNNLTPKQALDLSGSITGDFAVIFGKLVREKIEKILSRKSLPNEISEWLTILFRYSKKDYYEIALNQRIQKEVFNLPSFRRFFLFELDKEDLLADSGLYRYKG